MSGINVIREPKVYLVGRQQVDHVGLHRFLADEGVPEWTTDTDIAAQVLPEVAGRLCYMSFAKPRPGGNAGYLGHILDVGHGSVTEHAVWNFIITGVSRSFTHELVRHRVGFSYSMLSQRYVDETKGGVLDVVVPPALADEVAAASEWLASVGMSPYQWLVAWNNSEVETPDDPAIRCGLKWLSSVDVAAAMYEGVATHLQVKAAESSRDWTAIRKAAREAARSVLPNATETKIFVTGNARAVRHFLEQRGAMEADAEMRRVAVAMLRVVKQESPNLFADMEIAGSDGGQHIVSGHRKV